MELNQIHLVGVVQKRVGLDLNLDLQHEMIERWPPESEFEGFVRMESNQRDLWLGSRVAVWKVMRSPDSLLRPRGK